MKHIIGDSISLKLSEKIIFENADISIATNTITGIIGRNGAGKTSFFDLLCDVRRPDQGTLRASTNRHTYLSQTLGMPANLSMKEIYEMTAALACDHVPSLGETIRKFQTWDARLANKFSETLKKRPNHCSYGEIRFFFTLSLISFSQDLLVLDEPTAGVDPESRHCIWSFLKRAKGDGTTVVVSSHNINEISENCDNFFLIHKHQFLKFNNAQEFMTMFGGNTLDEAFIASMCS